MFQRTHAESHYINLFTENVYKCSTGVEKLLPQCSVSPIAYSGWGKVTLRENLSPLASIKVDRSD